MTLVISLVIMLGALQILMRKIIISRAETVMERSTGVFVMTISNVIFHQDVSF